MRFWNLRGRRHDGDADNVSGAAGRDHGTGGGGGARHRAGVNAALAVTGIAGPDGGTADKPVGMVWFAWSLEGRQTSSEVMHFTGDRDAVRRQTVVHALSRLQDLLS